ncbi:hypothetical protein RHGRI_007359 [Rhododendron griersonianum]|uniref:Uncharacterized protein n=1 Tax=Rhododendron griersonianum TaxID=479676 RepID=A0AAV6KY44_9ERIC|nr:hypothetical protein RHGRI_007359 [Rhododendron griersonianum]
MVRENSVRGFLGRAAIRYSGGVGGCGWSHEVRFFPVKMVPDDHKSYWGFLGGGNCDLLGCRDSSRSRRDRRSPAPSGLLIRNISLDARPEDLRIPFERFGAIKDIYLPKNYYTGVGCYSRGIGYTRNMANDLNEVCFAGTIDAGYMALVEGKRASIPFQTSSCGCKRKSKEKMKATSDLKNTNVRLKDTVTKVYCDVSAED